MMKAGTKTYGGVFFACALLGLTAGVAPAASARNPYPPVNENGTVGDAAGTDTAAYLNDKPTDRTGRGSPASGTSTPIPAPDAGGTSNPPTGSRSLNGAGGANGTGANGTGTGNTGATGTSNGTGNSNGTGGANGASGGSSGSGGSGSGSGSGSGGSGGGAAP